MQPCNSITQKFIEDSTCFGRHTAHHQELQTAFPASGLYTHVVTGRCPGWVANGSGISTVSNTNNTSNTNSRGT